MGTRGDLEFVTTCFGSYLFHVEGFVCGAAVCNVEDERGTPGNPAAGWQSGGSPRQDRHLRGEWTIPALRRSNPADGGGRVISRVHTAEGDARSRGTFCPRAQASYPY